MASKVRHVDIISNDPLGGTERLIARVWMNGGPELDLYVPTQGSDVEYLWSYLRSRVKKDPKADPIGFLNALPAAINGTYVFASPVHETADCKFVTEPTPVTHIAP